MLKGGSSLLIARCEIPHKLMIGTIQRTL